MFGTDAFPIEVKQVNAWLQTGRTPKIQMDVRRHFQRGHDYVLEHTRIDTTPVDVMRLSAECLRRFCSEHNTSRIAKTLGRYIGELQQAKARADQLAHGKTSTSSSAALSLPTPPSSSSSLLPQRRDAQLDAADDDTEPEEPESDNVGVRRATGAEVIDVDAEETEDDERGSGGGSRGAARENDNDGDDDYDPSPSDTRLARAALGRNKRGNADATNDWTDEWRPPRPRDSPSNKRQRNSLQLCSFVS